MGMPDLDFKVDDVQVQPYSAVPTLNFKLNIQQASAPVAIHSIVLRCQIRIEPARRQYAGAEHERLLELFGRPAQWHQTLRSMLWTNASVMVPAFDSSIVVDLPVQCSFDFNVAVTKYFDALEDGQVPLCFLFSGTVFYTPPDGTLQTAPISWEKEAAFRMPISAWKAMVQQHYPGVAWLCLDKSVFDRLREFKRKTGHVSLDAALDELLQSRSSKVQVQT
jgi:hypothetical protein